MWNWLPVRLSLAQPMLVFTTDEHGFRLQTLLNKVDELDHSILVVKATNGEVGVRFFFVTEKKPEFD